MATTQRRRTGTFRSQGTTRPVLYQLCRTGERFEVGDGPVDLSGQAYFTIGRGDPSQRTRAKEDHIWVDDPWMSSKHAELFATRRKSGENGSGWWIEDCGSTNGVVINGEAVGRAQLVDDDLVETGRTFWLFKEEPADLAVPTSPVEYGAWNTFCPTLAARLEWLMESVGGGGHVLVTGPEGSGKGFMARTIHRMTSAEGRLVHLDCRERSAGQLEIDLFGSRDRDSRLWQARGGTLFVENIEALPLSLQRRLATTLSDQRYLPSAESAEGFADVRLVASTVIEPQSAGMERVLSTELLAMVVQPHFNLPPLEERKQDLGLLLDDFLARARGAPAITREACRLLLRHPFSVHVRGLARVIEAGATLAVVTLPDGSREGAMDVQHLPVEVVGKSTLRRLLEEGPGLVERDEFADPTDEVARAQFHSESQEISPSLEGLARQVGEIEELVSAYDDAEVTDPMARHDMGPPDALDPRDTERLPVAPGPSDLPRRPPSGQFDLGAVERSYARAVDPDILSAALRKARGNVSAAARYLGKPRALVLQWMREFDIDPSSFR